MSDREECRPTIDGRESRKYWLSIVDLGKVTLPTSWGANYVGSMGVLGVRA